MALKAVTQSMHVRWNDELHAHGGVRRKPHMNSRIRIVSGCCTIPNLDRPRGVYVIQCIAHGASIQ